MAIPDILTEGNLIRFGENGKGDNPGVKTWDASKKSIHRVTKERSINAHACEWMNEWVYFKLVALFVLVFPLFLYFLTLCFLSPCISSSPE